LSQRLSTEVGRKEPENFRTIEPSAVQWNYWSKKSAWAPCGAKRNTQWAVWSGDRSRPQENERHDILHGSPVKTIS